MCVCERERESREIHSGDCRLLLFILILICYTQDRAPILHTLENATDLLTSRLVHKKNLISVPSDLRQVMILLEV